MGLERLILKSVLRARMTYFKIHAITKKFLPIKLEAPFGGLFLQARLEPFNSFLNKFN